MAQNSLVPPARTTIQQHTILRYVLQARWALDAAGAQYSTSPYPQSPFYVAELPLRWRVGNLTGKLTAPILITTVDRHTLQVIMDSTGIARWADKHGDSSRSDSARLFPKGEEAEVDRYVHCKPSWKQLSL